MKIETLGNKAAALAAVLSLMAMLVGFLDIRHAKAEDLDAMGTLVRGAQLDGYEQKIEALDDEIAELESQDAFDARDKRRLSQLRARRDKYLRKIELFKL